MNISLNESPEVAATTSGIGGSIKLVVSSLLIAAPERRRGFFSLIFGLQLEQLH